MRLWITRIELTDFRNYATFAIEPDEKLTVLVGPNAVGKTNIVEAIQLATSADSFRKPLWSELVREGGEHALVSLSAQCEDGRRRDVLLSVTGGRRTYKVNGTAIRALSDVSGTVPSVVFTPDDLIMVKGPAERRRAAVDGLGGQISRAYGAVRMEYERIVRQRNALLKEADSGRSEMEPWTQQLVEVGAHLTVHRIRLFERLLPHMTKVYGELTKGEDLKAAYLTSWSPQGITSEGDTNEVARGQMSRSEIESAMSAALRAREAEERARRSTLVGPHRDDIGFSISGRDARTFGSQGQQRTAALAWKISEVEVIEEITGTTPVLLLDDVMSELDETRRHALAALVGERTQTFVTTTNLGYFEPSFIASAKVVTLG